ncbi:MAG: flagellar basal body L-ring protein FlgH [Archangiaceae bacterium]|nr:flagellar basal body L-ring protein FlgH [Archangiaceae bacterium]
MKRALTLLFALTSACSVSHVAPYVPKHREYATPEGQAADAQMAPGSLFMAGQGASGLFTDQRAYRVNDLVVVRVEEMADATRKADTDIKRESGMSVDVSMFLKAINAAGITAALPALDAKVGLANGTSFDASGSTSRTEHLQANVPALVRKVLPNGNLFVEGHRVVLVNQEENHFYISGVVRPIDIDQKNTVKSNLMADAEVEFTGRGVITDNQRQGWLSRFFGWVWPF